MSGVAPAVSVVVPTFNRVGWVCDAVRCAASQTLSALEIIVVDDGSTDNTAATCSQLKRLEPRLRVVTRPQGGLAAARNTGLCNVRAPWVAFLDDDDLLRRDALEKLLASAAGHGSKAVACHALAFSSTGTGLDAAEILARPLEHGVEPWPPDPPSGVLTVPELLLRTRVPINAGLFATDMLRSLGGFDERRRSAEDYDLWLRVALHAPIPVVEEPLALVRRHPAQMSRTLGVMAAETRAVLEGFLQRHPETRLLIEPSKMRRRISRLAVEEAYAGLLAGRRSAASRAAMAGITRDPLHLKAYSYLVASIWPALYNFCRAGVRARRGSS